MNWNSLPNRRERRWRVAVGWLALVLSVSVFALGVGCAKQQSEKAQRERLFQRFIADMNTNLIPTTGVSATNNLRMLRGIFDGMVVHPSFGLGWDEVPPPNVTGARSMSAVESFVTEHGWQMQSGGLAFTYGDVSAKPLRGLPWKEIKDREFAAVTHRGVLYVLLNGWHHDCRGVAYNPKTNAFAPAISGFSPLGSHWYAWAQFENPGRLEQRYEGQVANAPVLKKPD